MTCHTSTPNTFFTAAHSNGKYTGKLKLHKEKKSFMPFLKHNLFNVLCQCYLVICFMYCSDIQLKGLNKTKMGDTTT